MNRASALLLLLLPLAVVAGQAPSEPQRLKPQDFAYGIPLEVDGDGALYSFDLPEVVYRKTTRRDLGDMRIFNGYNEVVPYLLKKESAAAQQQAETVELPFYPLYRTAQENEQGTEVHIATDESGAVVDFWQRSPQEEMQQVERYLIDATALQRPMEQLILQWNESQLSILETLTVEQSNDLAHWESVPGRFPLAALTYEGYRLRQHELELPQLESKYLRLSWPLGKEGITLKTVKAKLKPEQEEPPRNWLSLSPAGEPSHSGDYRFESGGNFPVDRVQVLLPQSNTVVKVRLSSRTEDDEKSPWQLRYQGVLYYLEREGHTLLNNSFAIPQTDDIHWRLEIEEEGGGIGQGQPTLRLGWHPHHLYFVARGETPFSLAYGAVGVEPVKGNLESLLQMLKHSQEGDGFIKSATPGPTHELGGERRLKPAPPPVPWKTWLLWSVLVFGVLVLALMARSLVRQMNDADRIDRGEE